MVRFASLTILLLLALLAGSAFAGTYYIDYSAGNDSNLGTLKTSAWQHAPGMTGCTAKCASTTPQAGDSFIFKGGVTWPNSAFGWQWQWSGSSGKSIYLGVDTGWYTGSSWARPIFNGGGKTVGSDNRYLWITGSYVTLDNIEWTGFYDGLNSPAYCTDLYVCLNWSVTYIEIKGNYFHGWTHSAYGSSTDNGACIAGDTGAPSNNANSSVHDNVFDGWDTAGDSMAALHGGPEKVYNNYIHNMTNGFVGEYTNVHDNVILNINPSYNPTQHENGSETNFSVGTALFYNNVIAHIYHGLAIWVAPESGYTQYVYNNVVYDITTTNVFDIADSLVNPSGSVVLYNNTMFCGAEGNPSFICAANIASSIQSVTLNNNHWITNANTPNNGVWSKNGSTQITQANDVKQDYATATSQGYTSKQTAPFSPTSSTDSTVGAGQNLSSLCATLTGLCSDATLGVSYNSSKHTVTYPARAPNTRPGSGSWDSGAYLFAGGGDKPAPPVGLQTDVH